MKPVLSSDIKLGRNFSRHPPCTFAKTVGSKTQIYREGGREGVVGGWEAPTSHF